MPTTTSGKAITARNATTHGLFARDVVLPSLGADPEGYRQLEAEWMGQLPPRTLLEHHYVEKIAAASWRLRRLHRWQAQLFEDDTLTENERLDRLDKVMRHETALHRQIDTAVKMLAKDAPQLYTQQGREAILADTRTAAREYHDCADDATHVDLRLQDHMYRIRKATEQALNELSLAPLDTAPEESIAAAKLCGNELPLGETSTTQTSECEMEDAFGMNVSENCQNELSHRHCALRRSNEHLDRLPTAPSLSFRLPKLGAGAISKQPPGEPS